MIKSGKITVKRNAIKELEHYKQKAECKDWIERCIQRDLGDLFDFENVLQDGIVLSELFNKISPGSIKSVQKTTERFKMMQNAEVFLDAVKDYGVKALFSSSDLVNKKHYKIVACIKELESLAVQRGFGIHMREVNVDGLGLAGAETIKKLSIKHNLEVDVKYNEIANMAPEKTSDIQTEPEKKTTDIQTEPDVELQFTESEFRTADFGTTVYIPENNCVIV